MATTPPIRGGASTALGNSCPIIQFPLIETQAPLYVMLNGKRPCESDHPPKTRARALSVALLSNVGRQMGCEVVALCARERHSFSGRGP